MSHIVKGRVDLAYKDVEVLWKALATVGFVLQNEGATIAVAAGRFEHSKTRYPLVLESNSGNGFRMGFAPDSSGAYAPFYDEYGSLGRWCTDALAKVKDAYIAYHYEKQLINEGYKVEVRQIANGGLEVLAEEAAW